MEDKAIVELYWQRDEAALEETQKKYGRYLKKIAWNVLYDDLDSEEMVNDTYLRAWNSMPEHRPERLSTYLGKITRQLSIDLYRRQHSLKRGGSEYTASLEELGEVVSGKEDPVASVELAQMGEAISRYLMTLKKETRIIFVSRYYFMDSIREIADMLQISEGKAKSVLFRTRQGLKTYLEKEDFPL